MVIFFIEAILKIIAEKLEYFKNSWNRLDFLILVITIALFIPVAMGQDVKYLEFVTTLRVLRVTHLLKLLVRAEKIRVIYHTLAETIPVLGSFSILLLIVLFMFSVLALNLFALVNLQQIEGLDRQLGRHANFQGFFVTFQTLFRCATGESWNAIMFELTWHHSILFQCVEDESYESIVAVGRDPSAILGPRGCGNHMTAFLFFAIFYILVSQVYLNLVIAIIVDAFTGAGV